MNCFSLQLLSRETRGNWGVGTRECVLKLMRMLNCLALGGMQRGGRGGVTCDGVRAVEMLWVTGHQSRGTQEELVTWEAQGGRAG